MHVLKDDAVPHIFAWSWPGVANRMRSAQKRKARQQEQEKSADEACLNVAQEEVIGNAVGVDVQCGKLYTNSLTVVYGLSLIHI